VNVRHWFLLAHRYVGLLATLPLVLLGLSGAILTFEVELDRVFNPAYWTVHPGAEPLSWQDVVGHARAAFPNDSVGTLRLPTDPTVAVELSLKSGKLIGVDPYTGKVLGVRRRDQILTSSIHQFHTRLLLGEWGERITGWSSLLLVGLSISGLILWWRRKGFAIRWSAPWRRVNYDAHHAIGIYTLLAWLILGLTGAAMTFNVAPAVYSLTRSHPVAAPALRSSAAPGKAALNVDAAMAICSAALPGARIAVVMLPTTRTGTFTAFMKFPEDHTPAGRSRVAIDQFSGKILWLENSRTAPAGTRIMNLNRPIHTGDIYGWATRLLACLASVLLAVQSISGVFMWRPFWQKRSKSNYRPAAEISSTP
jgi:uncharacterized iron-regulated membrane protein